METRTLTEAQWNQEGEELFGKDRTHWRFKCPVCRMETSVQEARRQYPRLAGRGWNPVSECLGRYVADIDCDWAAYGLFRGPWFVDTMQGHQIAVFPFAERKGENA